MKDMKLNTKLSAFFTVIVLLISCSNNSQDPADVDSGVTDTTNLFAPDTVLGIDTGTTSHVRDTGMQR